MGASEPQLAAAAAPMATTFKAAAESYLRSKTAARGTRNEYSWALRKWDQWGAVTATEELQRKHIHTARIGPPTAPSYRPVAGPGGPRPRHRVVRTGQNGISVPNTSSSEVEAWLPLTRMS